MSAADADNKQAPAEKKTPSMFARPKKQTPAEQLAYASSLRDAGKKAAAAKQYNALVHKWSDSPEAALAQLEYARLLEAQGDYPSAFEEYEYLIQNYPGGFKYSDVLESEFRIANCIMTTRHKLLGVLPGSPGYSSALPLFEKIVINGPQWSNTPKAQFNIGWIHEQLKDYDLAASAYELVQQNYPRSEVAADAAFQQGCCLYFLALERPHEERSLQQVRTHFQKFLRTYPNHQAVDQATRYLDDAVQRLTGMAYDRAVFYDKGGHPNAALIAYRDFVNKFPDSTKARAAQIRIEQLAVEANPNKAPEAVKPEEKQQPATGQRAGVEKEL